MMNVLKATGLAAALTIAPLAASAATLSLIGSDYVNHVLANNALGFDGQAVDYLSGDIKDATNGLSVDGPVTITYTYLGSEAANTNFTAVMGDAEFTNKGPSATAVGTSVSVKDYVGGLLDFAFGTTLPSDRAGLFLNNGVATPDSFDYAMGYIQIDADSFYVLFDDIAAGDRDFDDIGIRIDVAAVPLPAGGLLLLSGLGAAAAMRRRKKTA